MRKEKEIGIITRTKTGTVFSTVFLITTATICTAILGGLFVAAVGIGLNQFRIASVSEPQAQIPGLIGYYVFNGNASATVGPGGTIYGSPEFVNDAITPKAMKVDNKEGISVTTNAFRTSEATWSAFIKRNGQTGIYASTVQYVLSYGKIYGRFLAGIKDRKLFFYDDISNTKDEKLISSSILFPDGEWKHLAIVFTSDGKKKAYVNGEFVGEDATGYNLSNIPTGYTFNIGSLPGGFNYLNGIVDDVSVWNRALSQSEIKQICGELCRIISPGNALVYKFDSEFNFQAPGLLKDNPTLTIPGNNHVSLYFAGPGSNPEHASLRIAGEQESYLRWKVFKNDGLIDDFILQVGGTGKPYLKYTLDGEGTYKIELYKCPVNVIADINYSQHPYYSQLSEEEAQFYFQNSLDLFKMYQSYPEKYPEYSNRCLNKAGESVINIRYSIYGRVDTPVVAENPIGRGSCTMDSNKAVLDSSSELQLEPISYANYPASKCTDENLTPVFSRAGGEITLNYLQFNYSSSAELIYQCGLEGYLAKITGFKKAIKETENFADNNYVEYTPGISYEHGGIVDLLNIRRVDVREGFENDPQIRNCTSEYNRALSSISFDSITQCPPIIDGSYSSLRTVLTNQAKAKSQAPSEYYRCKIERLKQLQGKYLCELSAQGIIPWQEDFEGYKCDKVNKIEGLKRRAAYDGGANLSLSKDEQTQLSSLSPESRLKVLFDISQHYYLKEGSGGAYGEAKAYYDFKEFNWRYLPSFDNYASKECSVPGCSEGGHCSGMSNMVSLFFHQGDFINLERYELNLTEFNTIIGGLRNARPYTGRYKIKGTLDIITELREPEAKLWCHIWQVQQGKRLNIETLPEFYPLAEDPNRLATLDRDYFRILSSLTAGYAPVVNLYSSVGYTLGGAGHAILVFDADSSGFTIYDPNEEGSGIPLQYDRGNGFKLPWSGAYNPDIPLAIFAFDNPLPLDLKQKNCGQCYCGEAACVAP
ncbi:MAG: LamG domain-containing protein [Candidatus Magasanikbacteria bacterium]|nr:LamG domain-containing protein [Candidatus Magasanikbacteria bacterium]